MFNKTVWITALIGGVIGALVFDLCDNAMPSWPFLSRVLGIAVLTLVLVILLAFATRLQRKKNT